MKKSSLILILNLFLLQGCTLFGGGGDNAQNTSPTPTPTPENQQKPPDNSTNENTSDMLGEPGNENTSNGVPVARGLIPSINPEKREEKVVKGRNDPFSLVEVTPIVNDPSVFSSESNSDRTKVTNTIGDSKKASEASNQKIEKPSNPYEKPESGSLTFCDLGEKEKGNDPLLPEPKEARAVLISGIIDLRGEKKAIIQTSEFDYSYQVSEGAFLYGGEVLVSQIDSDANPPFVILEQYGREVIRTVGEAAQELSDPPLGSDGFGRIRNLILLQVEPQRLDTENPIVEAVICNDNDENVRVSQIELQVEEKESGEIINSLNINLNTPYTLKPGQKGVVDGSLVVQTIVNGTILSSADQSLGLRGKKKEELNFIMVGWR